MNQKINDTVNEHFEKIFEQLDKGDLDDRLNYLQWEDKITNILRDIVSTQGSDDLTDEEVRKEISDIGNEKGLSILNRNYNIFIEFIPDLLELELFEAVEEILQNSEYVNRELNALVLKTKQERNDLNKVRFDIPEEK